MIVLVLCAQNLQTEGAIASSSSEVPADWPNQGAITFNKYRMRYNDNLPLALKGVTLGIKPNEKIGIVGNSGSGWFTCFFLCYKDNPLLYFAPLN